ncbi:MAG TPA: AbrB/MazE/SpoVT family DNA-binding domain-containing protein [Ktedonobacterales bacterium]|nr:AbrB/MazE/SpoVT family DNA-binding domain-containing protein [Ktedonobacterales bacterium]
MHSTSTPDTEQDVTAGFSVIDEKGRVTLPKSVRAALGVHTGSSLAYVVVGKNVLFIPQDERLAELQQQAIQALAEAGLSVDDLLAHLPQAREAVMRESHRPEFLAQLKQMRESAMTGQTETAETTQDERYAPRSATHSSLTCKPNPGFP